MFYEAPASLVIGSIMRRSLIRRPKMTSAAALHDAASKPRCDLNPARCRVVPCCMRGLIMYSSQPALLKEVESSVWSKVVEYSKYRPTPLSIENFLEHGQRSTPKVSYKFMKQEVPTRLAGLLLEFNLLPPILLKQAAIQEVRDQYLETFQELLMFPNNPTEADFERFDEVLVNVRLRHVNTIPQMAQAVMDMKFEMEDQKLDVDSGVETAVQYFLDRLYMSKISLRMLVNQHLYVHGVNIAKPRHVGQIDPYCDVLAEIKKAYNEAARLCDMHYGKHPQMKLISNNRLVYAWAPLKSFSSF
jgi:pyruvate dehydrogenase kinase 2/3/4